MRARFLATLVMAGALTACGGAPDGPAVSDADRAAGAKAHEQLLTEFGGAYSGDEATYVKRLGETIAGAAGLDSQCTFTLVNSDVVNAFAVPGCYIYVTRGLMVLVNSEAELAAVLAHEVGHINARHSQRQQSRSLWRQLGVIAVGVLTGSERLTQIAGAAAGLFTLRYSRAQEFEADDLGLRYLRAAGHDPYASADMLATLGRHEQYLAQTRGRDEAKSIPEWARTHPLSGNRAERARAAAADTGISDGQVAEHEARYLGALDGMLYGDDPEQGFVMGRAFAHPVMRIAFEAPEGFTLTNSPQAILVEGPDGMRGEFAGGPMPAGGPAAYTEQALQQLLRGAQVSGAESRPARINRLDALITRAAVRSGNEQVLLTMAVYDAGQSGYHFIMLSKDGAPAPLDALFGSFRLIGQAEANALRPRIIDTVRAGPGDNWRTLAARMASDDKLGHILMLNGRREDEPLRPGEPVKTVVYGTR
ncbi:M48 family metalloprotease [Sphingomonas lutea]|uniref:M48 family metalloprotease n=1 Tax=Sphingomonas lutea TaxID=1045317 RepID=A0A7G9SKG6_9SPHN|nr:M48 family metalloprotease [Sphingomonas lutea]QNN68341.1 M48 family metalloprotease [Sphingomonas lutea]